MAKPMRWSVNRKVRRGWLAADSDHVRRRALTQREQGIAENVVSRPIKRRTQRVDSLRSRPYHRRLRACLGHRYGTYSDAGASAGNARVYPARFRGKALIRRGRSVANSLRRLSQTRQHCGLMAAADIDGALVGGASLKAESFAQIVNCRSGGTGRRARLRGV
jgi:hypothetical protein